MTSTFSTTVENVPKAVPLAPILFLRRKITAPLSLGNLFLDVFFCRFIKLLSTFHSLHFSASNLFKMILLFIVLLLIY
jgi:hypothetical protein